MAQRVLCVTARANTAARRAASVPAAGVTAQVTLGAASLKERFELTEVVEQTGGRLC
jgi:hypothetical protein